MKVALLLAIIVAAGFAGLVLLSGSRATTPPASQAERIRLPEPMYDSNTSVEEALLKRRSAREYRDAPLTLAEVSQLLWAAQGITDPEGFRTAPSAGALYPLEVYVATGNVEGIAPGVYRYRPDEHALVKTVEGDKRNKLSDAALRQPCVRDGAIVIVISGVYERTTGKYNTPVRDELTGSGYPRGVKYVHMEAGHAAQNICLQAASLGLGTVTIGAFSDGDVKKIAGMADEERPLYIMPVGKV